MKNIWKILFVFTCISCHYNTPKENKPAVSDTMKREAEVKKTPNQQLQHKGIMEFVGYNDDGDYFLLTARRKNETVCFINDDNEDRNLLRGDIIEVTWKTDTIYSRRWRYPAASRKYCIG